MDKGDYLNIFFIFLPPISCLQTKNRVKPARERTPKKRRIFKKYHPKYKIAKNIST